MKEIILTDKTDPTSIEITITKADGTSVLLGEEYSNEYFKGRSAFAKYLNDNN